MTAVVLAATAVLASPPAPARAASAPGATITVATLGDFEADGVDNWQWVDAVHARFDAANARGGIRDAYGQRHRVEVVACNTASDPERTRSCADQAVERDVAAVVGMSAVYGDHALPFLEAENIPVIGVRVNAHADAATPKTFPLASGLAAELTAMPQLLAQEGASTLAVIISDYGAATDDAVALIEAGRARTDTALGPVVRVPPGTTNLEAAVDAAAQPGVDGIVGFLGGGSAGALARQLRASDFTGRYVTKAPWGNASAASDPDPALDGTLVVGQFPPATANRDGWQQFRRDMTEYDPQAVSFNEGAVNYWLAARVFEHVVGAVDVTRIKQAALDSLIYDAGDDTAGFTPQLARIKTSAGLPRLFNRTVTFSETRAGEVRMLDRRFFDPFTGRFVR